MTRLLLLIFFFTFLHCAVNAQDAASYDSLAKKYISLGDYDNAIIIVNRGLSTEPDNSELNKDLVLCYYFQNNIDKTIDLAIKLINNNIADDQCYQIAGELYKLSNQQKEAENIYRKGLAKFPDNGPMYNELGNILWDQKNEEAISFWEKGIENDPNYPKNYFNAAGYYSLKKNWVWCVLYAETFVNLESFSAKTTEVKSLLINAYKNLLLSNESDAIEKCKGKFAHHYINNLFIQSKAVGNEINTATLIKIRARFILNWFDENAKKYPFKLFEYHQELLQNGLFEAYNQWLFGSSDNLAVFHLWVQNNHEVYDDFIHLQKSRIFKIPKEQYYQ